MQSWLPSGREVDIKGFVIAGTGSGSGKTTLTLAVLAFLKRQGYRVAPFKVGPDFIDPGHHTAITGQHSRNLDSWMLSRAYNEDVFARGAGQADVAVVEGVMGLFDGYSGLSEQGSTAQMAKWLNLPVILVVDARSMARSAAAIVQGFENFDRDVTFAGVIFSKTGSPAHYTYLKEAVEASCRMKCLGFMPRNQAVALPERHLGLVTSDEHMLSETVVSELVSMVAENTSLGELVKQMPDLTLPAPGETTVSGSSGSRVTVAVARDQAFCFYYQDNLDILEKAGADIVFFSPLSDPGLPEDVDGIYFGGGYPELFAETLSENRSMRSEIYSRSRDGMPIYGECGGFMYLCSGITGVDSGETLPMAGCFPCSATMSAKLRSLGYREITLTGDTLVGRKGDVLRGHEFHYSSLDGKSTDTCREINDVYAVTQREGRRVSVPGYQVYNTLGSYLHIHFGSSPEAGACFVNACRAYRQGGQIRSSTP